MPREGEESAGRRDGDALTRERVGERICLPGPASAFLAGPGAAPEAVRVSLSGPRDPATLRRGLDRIRSLALSSIDPAPVRL